MHVFVEIVTGIAAGSMSELDSTVIEKTKIMVRGYYVSPDMVNYRANEAHAFS